MYTINNEINDQTYNQLQVLKVHKTDTLEVLSISLEKDTVFPEHISPTDVQLIMLEGSIVFHIKEEAFLLRQGHHFSFAKDEKHWVKAIENSKFLIVR